MMDEDHDEQWVPGDDPGDDHDEEDHDTDGEVDAAGPPHQPQPQQHDQAHLAQVRESLEEAREEIKFHGEKLKEARAKEKAALQELAACGEQPEIIPEC